MVILFNWCAKVVWHLLNYLLQRSISVSSLSLVSNTDIENGRWLLVNRRCHTAREPRETWQWVWGTGDEYMIMSMWIVHLNKFDFKLGNGMRLRTRRITRRIRVSPLYCDCHSITHAFSLQTTTTIILILIMCMLGMWMHFSRQIKLESEYTLLAIVIIQIQFMILCDSTIQCWTLLAHFLN